MCFMPGINNFEMRRSGMNVVVKVCEMENCLGMRVRKDLKDASGCENFEDFVEKLGIARFKQGQVFMSLDQGKICGMLAYSPVKKGFYRSMEDRVILDLSGVSGDVFEEDGFNGSYGVIVGPYFAEDSQEIEALISDCIAINGNTRRYVAFADERTMPYFAVNGFKFIADVGERYLIMR